MIPLKDETPTKKIPFINIALVIANISIFIYQNFFAPGGVAPFYFRLGIIPYEFSHFMDIDPPALVPVPLTVLTATFVHGGWIHLFGNMLFLWIFGDNIEDRLGHFKYLIFYLLCGSVASLFHIFANIHSKVPCIGASGAIAGVLGAYMLLFPKARIKTLMIWFIFIQVMRVPAIILIGYWILIQILSGFAETGSLGESGVAWFAHIGGFVCGCILIMFRKKKKK